MLRSYDGTVDLDDSALESRNMAIIRVPKGSKCLRQGTLVLEETGYSVRSTKPLLLSTMAQPDCASFAGLCC